MLTSPAALSIWSPPRRVSTVSGPGHRYNPVRFEEGGKPKLSQSVRIGALLRCSATWIGCALSGHPKRTPHRSGQVDCRFLARLHWHIAIHMRDRVTRPACSITTAVRAFVRRRHDQLRPPVPLSFVPRAGEGLTGTRLGGLLVI